MDPNAPVEPANKVDPNAVVEHAIGVSRVGRPDVPPWLAAADLTFGQLRVLFRLRKAGPWSMSQLADWLAIDRATATGMIERLERPGLVERVHRLDDRRVVECRVTDAGLALLAEIDGIRLDATRGVLALLAPDELADFDRLLCLILERSKDS